MTKSVLIPVVTLSVMDWKTRQPTRLRRYVPHYTGRCGTVREGDELPALSSHVGTEADLACDDNEYFKAVPTEWVAHPVWTGLLHVTGYHGGRSSSCYEVQIDTDDDQEPVVGLMSCSSFLPLIARVSSGVVLGKWTVAKCGQNYMIEEAKA